MNKKYIKLFLLTILVLSSIKIVTVVNATEQIVVSIRSSTGGGSITDNVGTPTCRPGNSSTLACKVSFNAGGTPVTFTANPDPGYDFIKWNIACSGNGGTNKDCTLSVNKSLVVTFAPEPTLTLDFDGYGSGTVEVRRGSSTGPIVKTCESSALSCVTPTYDKNTILYLKPLVIGDSQWGGWNPSVNKDVNGNYYIVLDTVKAVTAKFNKQVILKIGINSIDPNANTTSGSGKVDYNYGNNDLSCPNKCDIEVPAGTKLTLTAIPADGSYFDHWSNNPNVCNTKSTCLVNVTSGRTITATFLPNPKLTLVVKKDSSDTTSQVVLSSVLSDVIGSNMLASSYNIDTLVSLAAFSSGDNQFLSWKNCTKIDDQSCQVTLNGSKTVTAEFSVKPSLTITKSGTVNSAGISTGTGTVFANNINCGSVCTSKFFTGEKVILGVIPSDGSTFLGWDKNSGVTCSNKNICYVIMGNNSATIKVQFK